MSRADSPLYIYADNAATTQLSDVAREAMLPYLGESFGNPGGIHRYARAAAEAVEQARETCAACLGASPREIFFTSGGTESDVWALTGCMRAARRMTGGRDGARRSTGTGDASGGRLRDNEMPGINPIHRGQMTRQLASVNEAKTRHETGTERLFEPARGAKTEYGVCSEPRSDSTPFTIITSAIEHHAILRTCEALEQDGCRIIVLPVDREGFVSPTDLENALAQASAADKATGNVLVSIMQANNEVGTIQDVAGLSCIAHRYGALFHTDAVQAAGHIPCNVNDLGVDLFSISGHKFHGPTGTGLLYVRTGTPIAPLITGGAQQSGMRAGTENVAGIVGMATALKEAAANLDVNAARVASARRRITEAVLAACPDVIATGPRDSARRLPSIASFICPDVDAELLMVILDKAGIAAATGSACSAGSTEPSHVITALGYTDPALARGTLRLSLADSITEVEVAYLCEHVPACIQRAHATSGGNLSQISLFGASA